MGLTAEQRELAAWYADGIEVRQMAEWRDCAPITVKRQLREVRDALAIAGLKLNRLDPPTRRLRVRNLWPSLAKAL